VNVYAPNKDSDSVKFYDHLSNVLRKDDRTFGDKIIVGGDFNCSLNPQMDKKGGIMTTRQNIVDRIEDIQTVFNLLDIWRVKNPNLKSFTWSQKSPFIFCKLDYWLLSDALFDMVKDVDIVPSIKTDHSDITLSLGDLENVGRGPGFWKMNQSLLRDNSFVEKMQEKLDIWKEEGNEFSDKRVAWDWVKYNVRLFAIQESKRRAKLSREEHNRIQKLLQDAQINFQRHPNDETKKELNFRRTQMETFYNKRIERTIIRSRARWHEYGGKSTKYFLSLVRKHIRKLCLSGVITTDPPKILEASPDFYKNLYSSQSNVFQNDDSNMFLKDPNIPKLSEIQKASCEGRISKEECKQALESFEPGKTPGNDELPVEFYKTFWVSLEDYLIDVFNSSFEYEMSNSQKQAIITLLDKKGRDRTYLENWRPISLINVDTKIVSKAVDNRMKKILPGIIHHNQSGFVKNRLIGETTRSILDIMQHTDTLKIPGLLLFIDFEKAFDSIEWDYLIACLKAFNFGPELIKWVNTVYKNVSSCILNKGFFSDSFLLQRGVRQGDPLSPYLFVVAVEILAIAIRSDGNIRGFKVGDDAYADDMTATLSDVSPVERLLTALKVFEKCSG